MDAERFDTLLRSLTAPRSRRIALGALLGGPLALLGLAETEARHTKKPCQGKADDTPCKRDGRCLSGRCHPKPRCQPPGIGACDGIDKECCSKECFAFPIGGLFACGLAAAGKSCFADGDCATGLHCVGYRCQ